MPRSTLFETIHRNGVLVVRMEAASQVSPYQDALAQDLSELIADATPACLVVTLASDSPFSSAFVNTLLQLHRQLTASGGVLRICATDVALDKLQTLNLVGTIFDVVETEDSRG